MTSTPPTSQFSYFQIQGIWGVTKHFGGLRASEEMVRLCHIGPGSSLLEVGSGVGQSACYIAAKTGCRVTGVDLSEAMVGWARERAARKGLDGQVQFRVADAQELPFPDASFDAVITESVMAFVPDKPRALSEFVRVVRPGGYVGLNEGTWIAENPPAAFLDYIDKFMAGARFQTSAAWEALLAGAGLVDLSTKVIKLNAIQQRRDERYGLDAQDKSDRYKALGKFIWLALTDAPLRGYIRQMMPSTRVIRDLFRYLGHGYYIGKRAG